MDTSTHVVAKFFQTVSQRFEVGTPISEADVPADNPLSWSDLKAGRFVVGADTKAAERAQDRAADEGREIDPPAPTAPRDAAPETIAQTVEAASGATGRGKARPIHRRGSGPAASRRAAP